MSLPLFQTANKDFQLMQTGWSQKINPLLSNPLLNGRIINQVALQSGSNVINHGLGRTLQGWLITGLNASSSIYDSQASNQMTDLTLVLNSSNPCTVNLYVF